MSKSKNKSNTKFDSNRYEVITQDGGNGDVLLPLPEELMNRLGWKPGDEIDFQLDSEGRMIMRKLP